MNLPDKMPDEVIEEVGRLLISYGYGLTHLEMYYLKDITKYDVTTSILGGKSTDET